MTFSEFEKRVVKIKKMDLPGESIQFKMAPIERLLEMKMMAKKQDSAYKAGVLMLFYPSQDKIPHFSLILRKSYSGVHSAQVAFPGGRFEEGDRSLKYTALRETEEEVGVTMDEVEVLTELTDIYIPPSNFYVQPYLGITRKTPRFTLQQDEVEELIEVSLDHFMDDSIIGIKTLSTSYARNIEVPVFKLNGHVVWGATAMMLSEVREMLKQIY
jgi:8-oxo-dGTP pyrophosphatase MutT (NUDIX family)